MKAMIRIFALAAALVLSIAGLNFIASAANGLFQAGTTSGYVIVVHGGAPAPVV